MALRTKDLQNDLWEQPFVYIRPSNALAIAQFKTVYEAVKDNRNEGEDNDRMRHIMSTTGDEGSGDTEPLESVFNGAFKLRLADIKRFNLITG